MAENGGGMESRTALRGQSFIRLNANIFESFLSLQHERSVGTPKYGIMPVHISHNKNLRAILESESIPNEEQFAGDSKEI